MFINSKNNPSREIRQAKTEQESFKKNYPVRKITPLFETKRGKYLFNFFRSVFPKSRYSDGKIRVLVALIHIDYMSRISNTKYANLRRNCSIYLDRKKQHINLLTASINYIAAVAEVSSRTVKRAIKDFQRDGFLLSIRKFTGFETTTYSTNHYAIDYTLLIKEVVDNSVDKLGITCGLTDDFYKVGADVDVILRYFDDANLSCLRILSANERAQCAATISDLRKFKEQKTCPLMYSYSSIKEYYSSVPFHVKTPEPIVVWSQIRRLTTKVIASSNETGSWLTKKAFTTQCEAMGLGAVLKGVALRFQDGKFVLDVSKELCSKASKRISEAIDRLWKRLLPHLYRISHFIGWFGRVDLKWNYF